MHTQNFICAKNVGAEKGNKMKNRLFSLSLLLALIGGQAQAEPILLDRIIAVVDKEIILQSDVEKKMHIELMGRGLNIRQVPEARLQDMFHQILENEIQQRLLLAKAREDSIAVDSDMIEEFVRAEIRRLKEHHGEDVFKQELERQGLTERQVRDDFRQQYRNKYLEQRMHEKLSMRVSGVPPREMAVYREKYLAGESDLLSLSHILIEPQPSGDRVEEARKKTEALLARIRAGEDFAELAREYSEDPGSGAMGGDLGYFSRGTMVPEFEEAAFSHKPGEVSDIVQSTFGFHIIRTEDITGDQVRARHILIRLQTDQADIDAAQQVAMDLYKRIQAGEEFAELAKAHSHYQATAQRGGLMGVYPKTELPPDFASAVLALKPGEVTLPVHTEYGWNLIRVNDDPATLEEVAKHQRLQDMFKEMLAQMRDKLYVDVRLDP